MHLNIASIFSETFLLPEVVQRITRTFRLDLSEIHLFTRYVWLTLPEILPRLDNVFCHVLESKKKLYISSEFADKKYSRIVRQYLSDKFGRGYGWRLFDSIIVGRQF